MSKLHTYYITNAKNGLKYSYTGLPEDTFHSTIQEAINRARISDDSDHEEEFDDGFDDDESDDECDDEELGGDTEKEDNNLTSR